MLTLNFTAMTYFGIWYPPHWSQCRRIAYKLYLLLVTAMMFSLVSFQIARLLFIQLSFQEFNDTFYFLLSTSGACLKFLMIINNRDQILQLLEMFQVECCKVRDCFEKEVIMTYDAICRKIALVFLIFIELTISLWLIGRTIVGIKSHELPYKVLQPYDLNDPLTYWLSYIHHMWAGFFIAGISMIIDATVAGFVLQLCGQFEILQRRLENLPESVQAIKNRGEADLTERRLLEESIIHHEHIYSLAKALKSTFNAIISIQFYVSSFGVCVSIYQLTIRSSRTIDLLVNVFYISCLFSQLCTYCFFGNMLTAKSIELSDALYSIDWIQMSLKFKKNLKFMILRSSKPIKISSGAFVPLTMASFTTVVKFAYSAYNVLKSTT